MDEHNEKPIDVIATNGRHGHVVYQEMKFSDFEKKSGKLSTLDAQERIYKMYAIKNGLTEVLSGEGGKGQRGVGDDFSSWRAQLLSGYIPSDSSLPRGTTDWMPQRRLRSSEIIPYFTIEDGTAATAYFARLNYPRKLATVFEFHFPSSCADSTNLKKFRFLVNSDLFLTFSLGIRLPDLRKPDRFAELAFSLQVPGDFDNNDWTVDLSVRATGCAVIWELGAGISLSITVCLSASADVRYPDDGKSASGSIVISISFDVNLPVIGSIIDFTRSGTISVTATPKSEVAAHAQLGATASFLVAAASITWVTFIFWTISWSNTYPLWTIGPVTF
ncbi:hypothetical protein FOL47_006787 [Perkinsus chesapeaki]|uniref:Uncharacterized protein n=1 Tax=Perkinsus chesapeaki TaxID=330153 RepID=A0A7J6LPJ5_PERCH|nr:hypothetical protein FOL47_006787 [Perkinsus chesapeaki]